MPRLFALFLCALGAVMVVKGLRQSSRARQTRSWTATTGRILESRVELLRAADEEGPARHAFVIRYAYEARGRPQESDQVWIGSATASMSEDPGSPRRWVERFPAGTEVQVWFDPADPRQAVLVRDVPPAQVTATVVVGAALVAIGLFALARSVGR